MATTTNSATVAKVLAAFDACYTLRADERASEPRLIGPLPLYIAPSFDRYRPCCEKAARMVCVCATAYRCPTHGEAHHGTHD